VRGLPRRPLPFAVLQASYDVFKAV
jgi:hypothetical protein